MSNKNFILPFCIYHKYDSSSNLYHGYIGNSKKDKSGNFNCKPVADGWKLNSVFYAVDPVIRPIPIGMELYSVTRNKGFPYNSTQLKIDYDFFFTKKNCVYFLTYNNIVPYTVPLYFYKFGNNIVPSFDKNPPTKDHEWSQEKLSPIYVLTEESMQTNIRDLRFKCVNGSCIPWFKKIKDMYIFNNNEDTYNIENCLMACTELNSYSNVNPTNLLNNIKNKEENKNVDKLSTIFNYNKYKKWILYPFFIFICLIILIFLVKIIFFRNTKTIFTKNIIRYM
jgi:hypothetical protein|tara:strand:- start:2281 stop:3120 length:840 start_codon:yes stop_codon:yes gene_type:complete